MSRCKKCGRNLSADETALHKKLYCRGATEFFCIECSAEYLNVSAELLKEKIEHFKKMGCTLFSAENVR